MLVPEDYRLELLYENTKEIDIRSWIKHLMEEFRTSPSALTRKELSYLVSRYTHSLKIGSESSKYSSYSYSWKEKPVEPQIHYQQGLTMLVKASLLLDDSNLFETAFGKDPGSVSEEVFRDIAEKLDGSTKMSFYVAG